MNSGTINNKNYIDHQEITFKMNSGIINNQNYIDHQDKNGCSALMLACEKGHFDVVEFLLQKGADIKLLSKADKSALMLAEENGHNKIVQLLKQY